MQGNTCRHGALFTNRTGRKTWQSGQKLSSFIESQTQETETVQEVSRLLNLLQERETKAIPQVKLTLTQLSASTLVHSTKSSAEVGSALSVDHHVHEKNMFHLAYENRESARLIERDTLDFVRFGAQGAIDQDLGRAYKKCLVGRKKPI